MTNDFSLPDGSQDPLANEMVDGFTQIRRPQRRAGLQNGSITTQPAAIASGPTSYTDVAATAAPTNYNSGPLPAGVNDFVQKWISDNKLTANQSDPNSLHSITQALHQKFPELNPQVDYTDANGHTGGILLGGSPYQLINGSNQWTPLQPWQESGGGGGMSAGGGSPIQAGGKYDSLISDQIMKLLSKGNTPVTEADVAAQYEPVSRAYQRGAQRTRGAAAERMAYSGLNSGGSGGPLDAETNSINESLAEKQAGTMGNLMQQELTARRQDVVNAINFAQGQEKTALQLQLAQIDKELRQQGMGLQNQQFYDKLGFDMSSHADSLDTLLASGLLNQ